MDRPTEKKKKKRFSKKKKEKKREADRPIEKKKKKRKEGRRRRSRRRRRRSSCFTAPPLQPYFVIVFFLFSFFSVFFPYKWDISCFGPVSIYWPKQPNFADTASTWLVRPVFFSVRNKGVICTGLLASTIYTNRYDTELTSLDWLSLILVWMSKD